MEFPKPQVPPRTSLLKKPADNDEQIKEAANSTQLPKLTVPTKSKISTKPSLPEKPRLNVANINGQRNIPGSNLISKSQIKQTVTTIPTPVQPNKSSLATLPQVPSDLVKTVSVRNKLKINASDLNKLRFKRDLYDSKNVDNKGNYPIYDVREDEEQIVKMNEICQLLVAGGYFRARIKGLHNFDKIVGGMCWAVQMCNVDLDIDIFYQESLSIGQKIALTEKIVRVFQKMKCPFKLEPHQIQGMDCIHIFPVIQWLVKKSFETRQQTADYICAYATWQFNRLHSSVVSPKKSVIFTESESCEELINPIKARLRRRFFHPARDQLTADDIRIKTTLLEYGVIGSGHSQRTISSGNDIKLNKKTESPTVDGQKSSESTDFKSRSDSDTHTFEKLFSLMTETQENASGNSGNVSVSLVGSIVSEQSQEIKRLAMDYEKKKASVSIIDFKFMKKEAKLQNAIALKKTELDKLLKSNLNEKLQLIQDKLKMANEKLLEAQDMEINESEKDKDEKLCLTDLLSALRKQKSELKQFCRDEKQRIEAQIEKLDNEKVDNNKFKDKLKEIDQELSVFEERYQNVKIELSTVNKRYALIQRKFDDIPARSELAQYQKRFLELYNQLSNKHNETKKFYTLFNTLADERMYLEKEFNLINSILDNFQKAYESSAFVKDEFVVKLEQIVDSIIQNKVKVEQRLLNEKNKRDQLNSEYIDLVEHQRLYYMAVKEFKEECKNNELLIAQL